jgi:hypothetical protein
MKDGGKSESGGEMGVGVRVKTRAKTKTEAIAQRKKEDIRYRSVPVSISTSARVHLYLHFPPLPSVFSPISISIDDPRIYTCLEPSRTPRPMTMTMTGARRGWRWRG